SSHPADEHDAARDERLALLEGHARGDIPDRVPHVRLDVTDVAFRVGPGERSWHALQASTGIGRNRRQSFLPRNLVSQACTRPAREFGRELARIRQIVLVAVAFAAITSPHASAAIDVSSFSVTPSTTQAGGHPNLVIGVAFPQPTTGVKDV